MATFTAIRCMKQSASSMRSVIDYVEQEKKTRWGDAWLVTGSSCVPQSAFVEMQMTKERFCKTGGTQFYHFVQSFSAEDNITPQEVNAIGLEFARKQFPDFEVVIATHVDTGHLHNHMVVNSVSHKDGHKLHQSYSDLLMHRKVSCSRSSLLYLHSIPYTRTPGSGIYTAVPDTSHRSSNCSFPSSIP